MIRALIWPEAVREAFELTRKRPQQSTGAVWSRHITEDGLVQVDAYSRVAANGLSVEHLTLRSVP